MEEYKNLKEIIELCEEELNNDDKNVAATLDLTDLKELRNVINKIKELEKHISFYEKNGSYKARIIELQEQLAKKDNIIEELKEKNEYYNDLMYALETYYDITEEDLENSVKEDV